jgi:hypothetical protein
VKIIRTIRTIQTIEGERMLDTMSEIAAQEQVVEELDAIELPPGATSLDLLQAIYRDHRQPMIRRMRAAIAALPFEHPKLAVTAVIGESGDFAALLELAKARSTKVIEARAEPPKPPPTDLREPPMVPDRRFRRI